MAYYGTCYGSSKDLSSSRNYGGSQLSLGGSSSSGGRSSYGGSNYDAYRRPASSSLDRSLSYSKGNVSNIKEKFGSPTTSSGIGTGRYSSADRSYGSDVYVSRVGDYGGRSGYASDHDAGSTRSYGSSSSYGRPTSVGVGRQSSYGGSASREPSPTRSSRPSYSRAPSVSRDYGSSRASSTTRDFGSSYNPSYANASSTTSNTPMKKSNDYNLTPFSTRRTGSAKAADTNLTPFSTRRTAPDFGQSYAKPTSASTAKEQPEIKKEADRSRRRARLGSDDSSDSADEPAGGNKDSSIRFLTSRACSPKEPDFELYESNKAVRKNKKRKRLIARTKTKIFPAKV